MFTNDELVRLPRWAYQRVVPMINKIEEQERIIATLEGTEEKEGSLVIMTGAGGQHNVPDFIHLGFKMDKGWPIDLTIREKRYLEVSGVFAVRPIAANCVWLDTRRGVYD